MKNFDLSLQQQYANTLAVECIQKKLHNLQLIVNLYSSTKLLLR